MQHERLTSLVQALNKWFFKLVAIIMEFAPIGAFGAMAFTVGHSGVAVLLKLLNLLLCVYATSFAFVFVVLGAICRRNGISLWRLLVYLRGELLIVLATSSSEAALPRLIEKMEALGCSKTVTGLVIPAGYSFNLDGTSIYLTIAALFIAQATNIHLGLKQQLFILAILMLNSKGAAARSPAEASSRWQPRSPRLEPSQSPALRSSSASTASCPRCARSPNLVGNSVATIVVARWEDQFDAAHAQGNPVPGRRESGISGGYFGGPPGGSGYTGYIVEGCNPPTAFVLGHHL